MKRINFIVIALFIINIFSVTSQEYKIYLPELRNQKAFVIKKDIDNSKIYIHNLKTEYLPDDSILVTIEVSFFKFHNNIRTTNSLINLKKENIGIFVDSNYIGPPIDLICSKTKKRSLGVDIGLVLDRSGSMSERISEYDNELRINALKTSVNHFLENLKEKDSTFILSFSNDIYLEQEWTNDKNLLVYAVNNISPHASTQLYGGLLNAINKINQKNNRIKAIIVLSDGINNVYPEWSMNLLHRISQSTPNTKIYVIALGLSSSPWDIDGRVKMKIIADLTGGKYFDVYSSSGLDSVYNELGSEIDYENYCKMTFKVKGNEIPSFRLINLFINTDTNDDITYMSEIPFIDLYRDWFSESSRGSGFIRVRFSIAKDEQDYLNIQNALQSLGYEIKERKNKFILDLVSENNFANEEEAGMFIEEFEYMANLYNNIFDTSKINTAIVYDYDEFVLPQINYNSDIYKRLFGLP